MLVFRHRGLDFAPAGFAINVALLAVELALLVWTLRTLDPRVRLGEALP